MRIIFLLVLLLLLQRPLFAQNQVQDKPTAATPANDDWLLLSGNTYKQRKIDPTYFGRVSSVGLSLPSIFSVSGSPVTTTGTLTGTLATQSANLVWAGPTTGAAAAPTFRSLVAADIPSLSSIYQPLSSVLTNTTASFTTAQESKLSGIASGATANSTDAQLRDRSTHTGTQALSTISQSGATTDQVPKWSGSAWVPGTITTGVSSVNGNTGAVVVQPQPTIAPLASTALVLSQDNVIRTKDVAGTLALTAADLGSAGDYLKISATIAGTQTITTDFPVYRNGASASENISQTYTDTAAILLLNMGGGVIQWRDEKFVDLDMPITATVTEYTPSSATLKGHIEGINSKFAGLSSAAIPPGTYFGWTTSDLGNKPANSLVADGTNGTVNAGTFASGAGTWLAMGGGTVSTPTADVAAGTYSSTQNVTLSSLTSGASIYYTTNGVDPTTSDTLFSTPVAISATATLKAKAFKTLYAASAVFSAAYTITSAYLINDSFAETDSAGALGSSTDGYDSAFAFSEPTSGTSTTVDPDATDMPGNGGAQSLKITNSGTGNSQMRYNLGTTYSTLWLKAKVYVTGFYSFNKNVLSFMDSGQVDRLALGVANGGQSARLSRNGSVTSSTHQFANSVLWYVWIKYTQNGPSGVYMSQTNSRPTSEAGATDVCVENTGPNYTIQYIQLGNSQSSGNVMWFEDVQVSETEIL